MGNSWKGPCAVLGGAAYTESLRRRNLGMRIAGWCALAACLAPGAWALDPRKSLTQYSRTVWTQERGLPQDTIRAITQTKDGYLWLGTDEGLARFDGYEFVVFHKGNGDLPDNSITALAAANDGSLWIGTQNGLTQYRDGRFRTFTTKDGLPDSAITALYSDHDDDLWIIAGIYLARYKDGKFSSYRPEKDIPVSSARAVCEDRNHDLWVAGFSRVARRTGGRFVTAIPENVLNGMVVLSMIADRRGNIWIAGNMGILRRSPDGTVQRFGTRDGLPDQSVRCLWADRDGNIWAGTNYGMARLQGNRFVTNGSESRDDIDVVRCLFEDHEGDLWIGANGGLSRWRNDIFMVYGKSEGLPSDEPNAVYQDRAGRVWVGFNDFGIMQFAGASSRQYTMKDGMPDRDVFQIREAMNGDLLISTRQGVTRMHNGSFTTYSPPDPLARKGVFDAIEDEQGALWLATPTGLSVVRGKQFHNIVPGGPLLIDFMVTLSVAQDGAIWAGTYGKGLWKVKGDERRQYTVSDGLSSDQIRSLYHDSDGVLWIATFGGGLNAMHDGKIFHYGAKDGLLSDNIGKVYDDGESLWLSTTRGICRISKHQLYDFSAHRRSRLEPQNYGVEDGLRSAQCAPAYPTAGGGVRTVDGRLWFTTGRGLAVLDPDARKPVQLPPAAHIVQMTANGDTVELGAAARLSPGSQRLQIRYTGIHLSAPERVQYFYRLEGLDADWVPAGSRRVINYNSLPHGDYRFVVRAELPDGGPSSLASYDFRVLPQFWETLWFRVLCGAALLAAAWAIYQLRLRQMRSRFALVLDERARLAREIHDTLAQGFVGISSQLDAVALSMPEESTPARSYLDLARRMARHSLTEARRSVMDLRSSELEGQDLAAAIQSGTMLWTAGSGVEVAVHVSGPVAELPEQMEQNLLRIAQEAVTNVLKHASANKIWVRIRVEARMLYLGIIDDGRGFDQHDVFASRGGHFGVIGMRERAERLGGELRLASHPGQGTQVEVTVPLP
jgi:signal transduction histidine kinase/ligand-binding sensor domain-containing protein